MNTKENLKRYLNQTKYEPAQDLAQNVWNTIVAREKRAIRFKMWTFSLIGATSIAGLIPASKSLAANFASSGFYDYFSVLFSNNGTLTSYWKELSYSIAESLPTTSIIFTFTLIFILFLSIRYVVKQFIKVNYNYNFA